MYGAVSLELSAQQVYTIFCVAVMVVPIVILVLGSLILELTGRKPPL